MPSKYGHKPELPRMPSKRNRSGYDKMGVILCIACILFWLSRISPSKLQRPNNMAPRRRRHSRPTAAGSKRPICTSDSEVTSATRTTTDRDPAPCDDHLAAVPPLVAFSPAAAEMTNTAINDSEWEAMAEPTNEFITRLGNKDTHVPAGDQRKLLHHAMMCGWPEFTLFSILQNMNEYNARRVLRHTYQSVSVTANLCLASTPGFWVAYFHYFLDWCGGLVKALKLAKALEKRDHLLFSRETWMYFFRITTARHFVVELIDAVWEARCYEKCLPPWFMNGLLGAGVRLECLTPFHYFSVKSHPLGGVWDREYGAEVQRVKEQLGTGIPSNAGFLFDLLSTESDNICDIEGFSQLYYSLPNEQRLVKRANPLRKGEECTALELLEQLWERRQLVMIPVPSGMPGRFNRRIGRMVHSAA